MRAKPILIGVFSVSLAVAAFSVLNSMRSGAAVPSVHILSATMELPTGTLLRAQDMTWRSVSEVELDQIVEPTVAAVEARPEIIAETQAAVYGAVLRHRIGSGEPIRRGDIVRPGDRDFLQVVLSPGARAIAIPVATGGASTGLLSPGDRVDVILTQNFKNDNSNTELRNTPLTRRSVGETIVQNLRVLAIDALETRPVAANPANGGFGRTVTLEVTAEQAAQISVAAELGKLSLTLRSLTTLAASEPAKLQPQWAGDVSPALTGAAQEKPVAVVPPTIQVFRGSKNTEAVRPEH
jgi:pilus assembly protein CpaB